MSYQQGPPNRGRLINAASPERHSAGSLQKSAWDCRKNNFRNCYSTVRWGCRSFRSRHTNNSKVGPPKCLFGIGRQYIINLLGLPGENIFWHRRIIIDRLGLLGQRLWGHCASSSCLGLRRHITSGVAGRYYHLDHQEDICITWDRTARFICFVVRSTTPFLCLGGRSDKSVAMLLDYLCKVFVLW